MVRFAALIGFFTLAPACPNRPWNEQIVTLFTRLRVDDEQVRDWFVSVLRAKTHDEQREAVNGWLT